MVKKPVETVYEIKDEYKIPSFEKFMKTYESDGNLNYDDSNVGDIESSKSYGPCSKCVNSRLTFKLTIVLKNAVDSNKGMTAYNVDDARKEAADIIAERGHREDFEVWFLNFYNSEDRQKLANRINAENKHINYRHNIIKLCSNKD